MPRMELLVSEANNCGTCTGHIKNAIYGLSSWGYEGLPLLILD